MWWFHHWIDKNDEIYQAEQDALFYKKWKGRWSIMQILFGRIRNCFNIEKTWLHALHISACQEIKMFIINVKVKLRDMCTLESLVVNNTVACRCWLSYICILYWWSMSSCHMTRLSMLRLGRSVHHIHNASCLYTLFRYNVMSCSCSSNLWRQSKSWIACILVMGMLFF